MAGIKVILNPNSGGGYGRRTKDRMMQALSRLGIVFDLAETEELGHGVELARTASKEGYGTIVAAGGDGTVSEVVNGMVQATADGDQVGRLACFPFGTGNDFAEMVGYRKDVDAVVAQVANGSLRPIDLCKAVVQTVDGETIERYFVNNMGLGLEADVTIESYKIRRMQGVMRYLVAALKSIVRASSPEVQLSWQLEDGEEEHQAKRILLVSVGNSPRTGGGFYMTPDAKLDDGLLDLGVASAVSRLQVLWMLPQALSGKHVNHPAMYMSRCRSLQVECAERLPVHLDGEVIAERACRIEVTVYPRRLDVLV